MKSICVKINGQIHHLVCNGMALFELLDRYKNLDLLYQSISDQGLPGLEALSETIAILAEQGELVRRQMGYDHTTMFAKDEIKIQIMPYERISLIHAVIEAITLGFNREIEPAVDEIDLGLVELNQKKTH